MALFKQVIERAQHKHKLQSGSTAQPLGETRAMARSRELLLLPGLPLLALLLLGAAPGAAAAVRGCQAEVLAPTVALFCAPSGIPDQWCCKALAHSAGVGGGARCLCRLAADELLARACLNGTDLLKLYASCAARGHGGAPSHPPAPSASTTCDGGAPTPADAPAPADSTGCDTAVIADEMELFCGRRSSSAPNPPWPCCEVVVASGRRGADGVPCFCRVPLLSSSFDVGRISGLYHACGGSAFGPGVHLAAMCPPRPQDGNRV